MKPQKFNKQFATIYDLAVRLSAAAEADAIMVVLDGPTDWAKLRERAGTEKILVAADRPEELEGAVEHGLATVVIEKEDAPVFEKLTQALLESVAEEILLPGAEVIAVYSGFEAGKIDSVSYIHLEEHLGRLTARDLRKLETTVPLETLKTVLDLALEIGREGREGKPVGTMFVVGDTRRVLAHCHPAGFDPVKGYNRKERSLEDARVREAVKEIAPLDGAFIVSPDSTVEKSCQLVDALHANLTLSKGLGSRHWAGAAISKNTSAIAVVVSESTGTVRLFQNGETVLRAEPFRRAMKWKDFEYEPPPTTSD
ncbi:MAG: DNA integrity scanning protein DisA nucleotide-binding domain protein [Planctomycetes bacterium]|nr:DNA integrity scanning protein DisA nucleotide-binding domain protein [Planctomycetota bacterium]MBL7042336.1 DNA integrity scanning protein DisA nucleotide-binding domain protein [Pirellulaceae bacterium]